MSERKAIAMCAASKIPRLDELRLPMLVSTKLDGIRCMIIDGVLTSRWNLPIPNKHVQKVLGSFVGLNGLDGELMLVGKGDFNNVQSAFMSHEGEPEFIFNVFDSFNNLKDPFIKRHQDTKAWLDIFRSSNTNQAKYLRHLDQVLVRSIDELEDLYATALNNGHEGLILRDPQAPYKWAGRSTLKQQWMLKLKPENDMEGTIVGMDELMHNADTSTNKKENQIPGNMMGALIVEFVDPQGEKHRVKVGTGKGLTQLKRQEYWHARFRLKGKQVTVTYQELSKYGIPRFPRLKGLREDC